MTNVLGTKLLLPLELFINISMIVESYVILYSEEGLLSIYISTTKLLLS